MLLLLKYIAFAKSQFSFHSRDLLKGGKGLALLGNELALLIVDALDDAVLGRLDLHLHKHDKPSK